MAIVYVYRGTFDPFHNNHAAICQWCLGQDNGASLVIHINYKQPSEKKVKNPASWENRFALIQAALDGFGAVTVSPEKEFSNTLTWITERHDPDAHIVQVLGDDVLDLLKDVPQVHSYAIHQRENPDSLESTKRLCDKTWCDIPLKLPNISSTQIRSLLIERNMSDVSAMVPSPVLSLLQTMDDYSPLQLSMQLLKKKNIIIAPVFAQQLAAFFKKSIYLKYEPERFTGLSGDVLVSVFCLEKGRIALCKFFKQGAGACSEEVSGYEQLRAFVKTPELYFVCDDGFCIELISGINAQSAHDFERIGLAYHALHIKSMRDIQQSKPVIDCVLEDKTLILCNKFSDKALSSHMKVAIDKLLQAYVDTTRQACVTHGDTQPGNTLLTEHDVVFIDASGANTRFDASRDVYKMVSSIYWKAYTRDATDDVEAIKNNIASFLNGYGTISDTPASKLWSLYYRAHSLILAFDAPALPLSEHIISEFKLDFPQLTPYIRDTSNRYLFWCNQTNVTADHNLYCYA